MQIDVTSYCNARCGGCARNILGGETQPWLKLSHFDKDIWYRLFTVDTVDTDIRQLKLNGNWGDAGMHPDLPEMVGIFGMCNPNASVQICTNGSTHNEQWWSKLGNALAKNSAVHSVDFAIDGLEDTHSIYRRRTDYNKILKNARAFAGAGGNSCWIMTLFDYNIHQIDDAIQAAKDNNFGSIKFRYSHTKNAVVETPTEEYGLDTDLADATPLPKTVWFNQAMIPAIVETPSDNKCPWYKDERVQIGPWHNVWPCCHIADILEGINEPDQREQLLAEIPESEWNNLKHHSLNDILKHNWYSDTLNNAVEHGTYEVCKSNCGIANG